MILKLIALTLLSLPPQHAQVRKTLRMPPNIVIQGPQGRVLTLSQGHHAILARMNEDLYGKAVVQIPGNLPVSLEIPPDNLCDGSFTQLQVPITKKGQQDHPYRLWSKSGDYIALSLVPRQPDGSFDFRNTEMTAFDTNTGLAAEFKGPTSRLTTDTFRNWSSEKPDVAILTGNNQKPEEAHRVF